MLQEFVAESRALMRAFYYPCYVRHHEARVIYLHDPEVRSYRREVVIRYLRLCTRGNRQQCRFADIRESYQPYICYQLHFEYYLAFFCKSAGFRKVRRLSGGRRVLHVALAAFTAFRSDKGLAVLRQVLHHKSRRFVYHNCADRNFYHEILAVLAVSLFLHSILTVFRLIFSFISKIHQSSEIFICLENNVSAFSSVSAVRSAFRHEWLSSERNSTISAFS